MNKKKLLAKLQNNSENVKYNEFVMLIEAFNFKRTSRKGSHEIYKCDGVHEFVNIQNLNGNAKSYQVEQFLSLIRLYNLELEDE
jgi:predicted RNA binding protein YcfA (HicA-like mRNA interferase family)